MPPPVPPPAARCPSPRPPACGWDARGVEGRSIHWRGDDTRSLHAGGAGAPPRASGFPPPAIRRRDRQRADGDARGADGASVHGLRGGRKAAASMVCAMSGCGWRARPACTWRGCAGRYFRVRGFGGNNAPRAARCHPGARGPSPRPAGVRMGMGGGRRAAASNDVRGLAARGRTIPGASARGHFAGTPTRSLHAVARLRRAMTGGCPG